VQSTTTGCGFTTTPRAYDDATPALKSVLARKRGLVDEYRQSESSSTHTARLDASANVRRTSERSPSSTSFRTCTEAGRERRSGRPLYIVVVERISRGKVPRTGSISTETGVTRSVVRTQKARTVRPDDPFVATRFYKNDDDVA